MAIKMDKIKNIVSMSGGKDSTATALLALTLDVKNLSFVFADTGHEHAQTYEYLDYLEQSLDVKIERVRADFSEEINRRRKKLEEGDLDGWGESERLSAVELLKPTGNPFLDLSLWKGRFPSSKARFCTYELKVSPIFEKVFFPLLDQGHTIWSWQGVRRDESLARRFVPEFEEVGGGCLTIDL